MGGGQASDARNLLIVPCAVASASSAVVEAGVTVGDVATVAVAGMFALVAVALAVSAVGALNASVSFEFESALSLVVGGSGVDVVCVWGLDFKTPCPACGGRFGGC